MATETPDASTPVQTPDAPPEPSGSRREGPPLLVGRRETLSLDEVRPYWRNPRKNAKAIAKVKASIEEFGYLQDIVIDVEHIIVVGDTRYRALRSLGWKTATFTIADHLTPEQARAYRIVDNRTAEFAEWDAEKLMAEVRELNLPSLESWYSQDDIAKILGTLPTTSHMVGFAAPQPKEAKEQVKLTCPGCGEDFWVNRADVAGKPA